MKMNYKSLKKIKLHPIVRRFWLFTLVILVLLIVFLFLPWQQTVKGIGEVIAYHPTQRNYYIYSPISGFIKEFYVQEDQFVKKGTKLFTMIDLDKKLQERLKIIIKNTELQLENSKKELKTLQEKRENLQRNLQIGRQIYDRKITQIQQKIESLYIKKVALEKNLEITKINYERIKKLFKEGIESKRKLELAENKLIKASAELNKLLIDIKIEQENLKITKQEKKKFEREMNIKLKDTEKAIFSTKNKINTYQKELQKAKSQLAKFKTSTVYAEKDGYVVRILQNDKNQYIKQGEKIVLFSPTVDKRAVLLKVRDFDMPLIKEGLPVRLQFYGWPTLQIPGWPVIRFGTFGGIIEKIDPVLHEDGFYYAYIVEDPKEPWPPSDTLKIGTKATGWVRLSIVPMWYEIWRRVNAFPPKMVNPYKQE
ncbi:MAG: HlyD family efflux transporter periplasmic adaptor subunit [Aquificae bacterium]|nr:HlyD family efflux transporter periplasmic adaptor subunit [Aquificota bacterium]